MVCRYLHTGAHTLNATTLLLLNCGSATLLPCVLHLDTNSRHGFFGCAADPGGAIFRVASGRRARHVARWLL